MKRLMVLSAVTALCLACGGEDDGDGALLIMRDGFDPSCDAGKLIAYVKDFDIYFCDEYGGHIRRVTNTWTIPKYNPCWSPDGEYIAYEAYDRQGGGLFVIPKSGGDPVRLTPERGRFPCWSPDGRTIAYNDQDSYDIWVVPAAGGEPARLTTRGLCCEPTWSRDGRRIYFAGPDPGGPTGPYFLWCIYVETGRTVKLWPYDRAFYDLAISPDGEWLAAVFPDFAPPHDIWLIEIKTGNRHRLTDEPGHDGGADGIGSGARSPGWAEDGRTVFFQSYRSGESGVYKIRGVL